MGHLGRGCKAWGGDRIKGLAVLQLGEVSAGVIVGFCLSGPVLLLIWACVSKQSDLAMSVAYVMTCLLTLAVVKTSHRGTVPLLKCLGGELQGQDVAPRFTPKRASRSYKQAQK